MSLANPNEPSRESKKDKKIDLWNRKWQIYSLSKDCMPASAQGQGNQDGLMAIFWKARNLSSTPRKSNQERNDHIHSLIT